MKHDMLIGINIHNSGYTPYTNTLEENLDAAAGMGMNIIRCNNCSNTPEALAEIRRVADGCHARGMKLMLCMDHSLWFRRNNEPLAEIEAFYEAHMEKTAAALGGAVDIYQIFNETDVACMGGDIQHIVKERQDGLDAGEYDSVMFDGAIAGMRGSLRGLKRGYPAAVTCVNFAWWHTALLYAMHDAGFRFDVIGLDWYSDAEEVSDIALVVADVCRHIPDSDLMICETNYWMNLHPRWDENQRAAVMNEATRDAGQAEWVPSFVKKCRRS
ncbi:MAG: hypothetical protein E7632_02405 [Ruminococcaceae bacterium]|nr:hypothetical protein [Oscillospiraceae bacterium]